MVDGRSDPWAAGLLLCFRGKLVNRFYLILLFGSAERVTRGVSLYFMSNIAGRLIGTQLSGLSYQFGGLPLSLATSGHIALASWLAARPLRSV